MTAFPLWLIAPAAHDEPLLVAGSELLARAVAAAVSGQLRAAAGPGAARRLIATRGALAEIDADWLAHAAAVVAIDPSEADRLAVLRAMAGDDEAHFSAIPSLATVSTAEHTLLLMLALSRRLLPAYSELVGGTRRPGVSSRLTAEEGGSPNWVDLPEPATLFGRTLGLIGLGRIGQAVAERAVALGLRVLYHDLQRFPRAEARLGLGWRRLDELLREADIVSLHLPLTPQTIRLIDAPELALLRPEALLINTAHGRLVDEGALIKALRLGAIAGAGLDVFAYEALPQDSPLIAFENVVLTPHVGGVSPQLDADDSAARAVSQLLRLIE